MNTAGFRAARRASLSGAGLQLAQVWASGLRPDRGALP